MSIFDKMPIAKNSRGTFDLSKMHTSTMDFFRWDVAHCMPLVPNDVVSLNIHTFVQAAPNPFPINGRMQVGTYAFYVPSRIVWDGWTKYITDLQSGLTIPYFTFDDLWSIFNNQTPSLPTALHNDAVFYLSNIMNLSSIIQFLPISGGVSVLTNVPSDIRALKFSAIPLRCAQRIWFDWMRDKAHISDAAIGSYCLTSGGHITQSELVQLCTPKYRCYSKNYITTAFDKPSEVNSLAPAQASSDPKRFSSSDSPHSVLFSNNNTRVVNQSVSNYGPGSVSATPDPFPIVGTPIQDLRSSNSLQSYAERMLVAGKTVLSRFQALFGTNPTIEELQMSDYLGGHEEDLLFQQTSAPVSSKIADDGSSLNSVGAFGYNPNEATIQGQKGQDICSGGNGSGLSDVTYKTDEHGYLFVFCAITPLPQYYQGLDRDWFRGLDTFASDKFDFFHPDFENEGLQPVLNYEVMLSKAGTSSFSAKGIIGFQQKYMDYKYAKDSLGGAFVFPSSKVAFAPMHLGRDVQKLVEDLATAGGVTVDSVLTPAVLTQATNVDEAAFDSKFSITNQYVDHFIVNHKISCIANRPMVQNAIPALSANETRITAKDLIETSGFRL